MKQMKDIFDKIMCFPVLNLLEPFYVKHKEVILYLFFGGLTFLVSIGSYALFNVVLNMNELLANIFSWILAVLFAYLTNRKCVFQSSASSVREFCREMVSFVSGRIITLIIEEIILFFFITMMAFNSITVKVIAQIVVIVLNYIISKCFIFKSRTPTDLQKN